MRRPELAEVHRQAAQLIHVERQCLQRHELAEAFRQAAPLVHAPTTSHQSRLAVSWPTLAGKAATSAHTLT